MARARRTSEHDEETIRSLCAEILNRIKTEGDLDLLNEYRSHIRKNVPFFMRSYFSAYLLMELNRAVPGKASPSRAPQKKARGAVRERENARPEAAAEEKRERKESAPRNEAPRRVLPDEEAARLFLGVGRNRRAYARDILAFIEEGAGVGAESVGEIRVLDNFSFVQVRKESADDVISSLNGKEFRGRSVTVSYAKPKKEESPSVESDAPAPAAEDDSDVPAEPDNQD